jgi:hypothetical protein
VNLGEIMAKIYDAVTVPFSEKNALPGLDANNADRSRTWA